MDEPRCLHCEIAQLVDEHIALGQTINEIVFKMAEAMAQVFAGVSDHQYRRRMIRDVERQTREMVIHQVSRRASQGVAPFSLTKIQ